MEEVLNNFILSGGYSSFEKLNACIITRGLLYVQSGENKEIIQLKLASMLGEKLFKTMMSTNQKERYLAALAKLESDKPEPLNESRQFELRFLEMNDNTIQMILRYITNEDCVKAFSGCSYKGIHKMLNNLSLRYGESILDGINCCNAGKQDISDAQERILEKINELEKNG